LKNDCIMEDEEGKQLVGAPFERRMNWTELLQHQAKYVEDPVNNRLNLIAHIENFIIIGKNVLEPNDRGELITTLAASLGLTEVIDICKKAGLDMNKPDLNGYTPLIMALIMDHPETVELLLEVRHSWNTSCRYSDLLVDPNRCTSGGQNVPPLLVAAYNPPEAKHMIDFLCSKGADIDFECETGNIMHVVFNMYIGQYVGFGIQERTELLETIIEHAKMKDVEQTMLDYRLLSYNSRIANFPPTVLDRLVWNNPESDEVNAPFIDFLVKEGATIYPSVLVGLLQDNKFDLFERIFTNPQFRGDKIKILSAPWHGGSFRGNYDGPSPHDPEDFCVTITLESQEEDQEPITANLHFTRSFKFVRGEIPYSCKLAGWDDDDNEKVNLLLASMEIWPGLCVKSIHNQSMENLKYEEVKRKFQEFQQGNIEVELSMGSGYQRQLVKMAENGQAPEKFLDLTRQILDGSSSPFFNRLNNITPGNDPESPAALEAQANPESPRGVGVASDDDVPSEFGDMFNGSHDEDEEEDAVEKRGPEEAAGNNQDEEEDESNIFHDMFGSSDNVNAENGKREAQPNVQQEEEESGGFSDMFDGGEGGAVAASSPAQPSNQQEDEESDGFGDMFGGDDGETVQS